MFLPAWGISVQRLNYVFCISASIMPFHLDRCSELNMQFEGCSFSFFPVEGGICILNSVHWFQGGWPMWAECNAVQSESSSKQFSPDTYYCVKKMLAAYVFWVFEQLYEIKVTCSWTVLINKITINIVFLVLLPLVLNITASVFRIVAARELEECFLLLFP